MSWPWQTKTLLELVRDAGLLPEVNIIFWSAELYNFYLKYLFYFV